MVQPPQKPTPTPEGAAAPLTEAELAANAVNAVAQGLASARMYGPDHNVTRQAIAAHFPAIADVVARRDEFWFSANGEELLVNGKSLFSRNSQLIALARRMQDHGMPTLTFNRGFDQDEFEKLIAFLSAPPASGGAPGGGDQALRSAGLTHVAAPATGTIRAIRENEVVVRRDALKTTPGMRKRAADAEAGGGTPAAPGADAHKIESALAFLKASASAGRDAPPPVVEIKTGPGGGGGPGGGDGGAPRMNVRALASVLSQLARLLDRHGVEGIRRMGPLLEQTAAHVLVATRAATHTIGTIEKAAREPNPDLKRYKELIALIAELAQELSQPLTVINATLDILGRPRAGAANEGQGELLVMAADSGKRLAQLIDRLIQIAGTPEDLSPNAARLNTLYDGAAPA